MKKKKKKKITNNTPKFRSQIPIIIAKREERWTQGLLQGVKGVMRTVLVAT